MMIMPSWVAHAWSCLKPSVVQMGFAFAMNAVKSNASCDTSPYTPSPSSSFRKSTRASQTTIVKPMHAVFSPVPVIASS